MSLQPYCYNTQVSQTQLEKLSSDLNALSEALAGGHEMRDLLDRVVETMMRVLGADASSLFMVDEAASKVVVQAAAGYQKPLVDAHAKYDLGEGITGWIAKEGRAVRARTLDELHTHPAWKGTVYCRGAVSRTRSWGCRCSSRIASAARTRSSAF